MMRKLRAEIIGVVCAAGSFILFSWTLARQGRTAEVVFNTLLATLVSGVLCYGIGRKHGEIIDENRQKK